MDKRELYNSYGTDDTPLDINVDYSVDQYADFIMTKLRGRDVRGALSFSLKKVDEVIDDTTNRQGDVEQQFQQLIDETTGKDVISAPEIIAARNGEANLKARFENNEIDLMNSKKNLNKFFNSRQSISSQKKKDKKPLVSFILDDGTIEDYTKIKPIAERTNCKIGVGVVTSWIGESGYMNYDQINDLTSTGLFEVLSHSHNHEPFSQMTENQMVNDLEQNLKELNDNNLFPEAFVYPFNANTTFSNSVIGRYFSYAFAKDGGSGLGANYQRVDNLSIRRISLGSFFDNVTHGDFSPSDTLDYYKERVDEAIEENNWLVFVMHPRATSDQQLAFFEETINYIKSQNIDIVLPSEGFDIYGNLIQTDNFTIKQDGEVNSEYDRVVIETASQRSDFNNLVGFPIRKITYTLFDNNQAVEQGLPENQGGVLITYRFASYASANYQEYLVLPSQRLYRRRFDNDLEPMEFVAITDNIITNYYRRMVDITIPSNSFARYTLDDLDQLSQNYMVQINPLGGINSGVIYNGEISSTGKVRIGFYNTTNNEITINRSFNIEVKRVDNYD